jgi:hypothetical protein
MEILYQGDPKVSPTFEGSIIGSPKEVRSAIGNIRIDEDEKEDEEGEGVWKGWPILAVVLCSLAVISSLVLGPAYPLSVIAYTMIAEITIILLLLASFRIFLQRAVGFLDFWKETPRSGGDKQKLTID